MLPAETLETEILVGLLAEPLAEWSQDPAPKPGNATPQMTSTSTNDIRDDN
jgi:hypothetical protein